MLELLIYVVSMLASPSLSAENGIMARTPRPVAGSPVYHPHRGFWPRRGF
jgi:hypothetical protein